MGLRLAPLCAPVGLLVFLLPPEAAKALHQELWPQEWQQVTIPGSSEPPSAPGGRQPGEEQHRPAGVGRRRPRPPGAQRHSPGVRRTPGDSDANAGGITLGASSLGTHGVVIPLQPPSHSSWGSPPALSGKTPLEAQAEPRQPVGLFMKLRSAAVYSDTPGFFPPLL